jgi:hypothetical protein
MAWSAPGPARSPVRGGPQSTEPGPGQTQDLTAEGDWDLICKSILDLGRRFADARNRPRLPPSVHAQASDLKQERISTSL